MYSSHPVWGSKLGAGPIGVAFREKEITQFGAAAQYVKSLRYARTSEPTNPISVLKENRGTCSSKHALLALASTEIGYTQLKLMLCFFEMSGRNTAGVESILESAGLPAIPEAHCFLSIDGERYDFTGLPASNESPFDALLFEQEIEPHVLLAEKTIRHRMYIDGWAKQHDHDPQLVWQTRERCIAALSNNVG